MNLITGRQVERDLRITARERKKLELCHVIPAKGHLGGATAYDGATVQAIKDRPEWIPLAPAIAVRLAEPAPDPQPWGRTLAGWDERWPGQTKRDGARGVWAVKDGQALIDQNATLLAVVSIVIVGAWRIVGGAQSQGLWHFNLGAHPDAADLTSRTARLGRGALQRTWL